MSALWECAFSVAVGAFIGWFTNLLAIKALFRPRTPWDLRVIQFQGLLPKRQKELAENLGRIIEGQLVSAEELVKNMSPADLEPVVQDAVHKFRLEEEQDLKPKLGKIGDFIPLKSFFDQMEGWIYRAIQKRLPEILEKAASRIGEKVSVKDLVEEKVRTMDLDRLEDLVYRISDKEMKMIEYLGGILGAMVGAIQWAILRMWF